MNSTLALKKSQYEAEVGYFMGFQRGEEFGDPAWDDNQRVTIQFDVASGLRRFYYCDHPWSFLNPFASLTLHEDASEVLLPDDCMGVDGGTKVSVSNSSTGQWLLSLNFRNPALVHQALLSMPDATGLPQIMGMEPIKGIPVGQMQRFRMVMFPKADRDYVLTFPYTLTANYLLDVLQPYAYGGVEHHETILESCLAVAELRRDNRIGVHATEFQRLLAISMHKDRLKNPTVLGMNMDRSDGPDLLRRNPNQQAWMNGRGWTNAGGGVTIDGTYYS